MDEQLFPDQQFQPPQNPQQRVPGGATGSLASAGALSPEVTAIATRIKLAEESLLTFEKDIKAELRAITKQAVELRKHISEMNAKIDAIMGEVGNMVQKPEFATAERYLDLWQPMEFVTREEAKRLIAEAAADAASRKREERPTGQQEDEDA